MEKNRKQILKGLIINNKKIMKLRDVVNSVRGLDFLFNQKLQAVLSYKLSLFQKRINELLEVFYTTINKKIKEYGEEQKDKDGKILTGQFKVKDENLEKFNKEREELLDQDVELNIPDFNIAELGDIKIEPNLLITLQWLIKE